MPGFWVSAPVAGSRSKTATTSDSAEVTYALLPSGLTATKPTPSSALPFWHAPPVPSSETQPAVPGFWVNAPVAGSRSKTATASAPGEAT